MSTMNSALGEVQHSLKAVADKLGKNDDILGKFADELDVVKREQEKQYTAWREQIRSIPSDYGGKLMSRRAAEGFGVLAMALAGKRDAARKAADEYGVDVKTLVEGTEAGGGILVPRDMAAEVLRLQDTYGVMRQLARVVPMSHDSQAWPVASAGLTVYQPGEGNAITASTPTLQAVNLVARKWGVLTAISSELSEDAVIGVGEYLVDEVATAMSEQMDDSAINGDGSSTYLEVLGVRAALQAGSKVTGSGNAYSELTLADFQEVIGLLPNFADANARWLVHRKFFYEVMQKLAFAAGGVTAQEITLGVIGGQTRFLGYPVHFSSKMPSTEANTQVCALFGDFRKSCLLGVRRDLQIARSTDAYFSQDLLAVRATQRQDFVCVSRGDASNPGGIIGLKTADS
ncbi:MAG: phage major capsid protein [Phycisphaerae bacterium]|nr:phage major capsid protein [Phycisphaerae bacterium]